MSSQHSLNASDFCSESSRCALANVVDRHFAEALCASKGIFALLLNSYKRRLQAPGPSSILLICTAAYCLNSKAAKYLPCLSAFACA